MEESRRSSVQRQEALQCVVGRLHADSGRGERATDEHRRTVADHVRDGRDRKGLSTQFDNQRIGRIGQILLRVDQGAIEIEDHQRTIRG